MSRPVSANDHILIVDDEPQALKYFEMGLADVFKIRTASSADEAEAVISSPEGAIAVLISDQRMPGRTGASLLASVRNSRPDIIRILTTAYSDLDGAIEAVNKGEVFRYITKPWDIDNLRQEMRIAMQVYELQRDRDALLSEKLSVKQRFKAAERARHLVAICGALPAIDRLHEAVAAYVGDMATFGAQGGETISRAGLDMWSDAENEATFAKAVAHGLAILAPISGNLTTVTDQVKQLLGSALPTLVSGANQISEEGSDTGIKLTTQGPKRESASDPLLFGPANAESGSHASQLLKAYALAYAVGGELRVRVADGIVNMEAVLPSKPTKAAVADDAMMNKRIFQSLERWD